jgi:hypothetical protein
VIDHAVGHAAAYVVDWGDSVEIMLRLSAIGAEEVHHIEIRRGEAQNDHLAIIEPLAQTPPQRSMRKSCSNQAHDETKLRKKCKGDCYPPKRPSE